MAFAVCPCFVWRWIHAGNGLETFSFYYDALTENVNYPARAAYLDGLVQKYKQSAGKVMLDLACGTAP